MIRPLAHRPTAQEIVRQCYVPTEREPVRLPIAALGIAVAGLAAWIAVLSVVFVL